MKWDGYGAFGFEHARQDHNMSQNAMGKIVNVSTLVGTAPAALA
ncbi:hypothetical protein [Rhodococcus marinonascens]|nr:hypothetical protein [Rhodococcus marinonascens]